MTNNSSVLLYLFRAQISSILLGIIYGKKQEPTPRKEHKVNTPYSRGGFRGGAPGARPP